MVGLAFLFLADLMRKIKLHLKPTDSSQNSQSGEILKLVYKQVESLEELAKRTLNTDLDYVIYLEVKKLEGVVYEIDPKCDIKEKINSITPSEEEIMKHSDGLYNTFADYEDDGDDCGAVSSEMIGMREVYKQLKDRLMSSVQNELMSSQQVASLVRMPGIGKTALADKIFNDPAVVERVRVGKKYRAKDISQLILEMDPGRLQILTEGDEEYVAEQLNLCLKRKKHLIVLDDVWDRFTRYHLYDQPFLHPESQSRILITSRLEQLDRQRRVAFPKSMIKMRLLSKEESWDLFRGKMFSQGSCPPQFEKAGKKISEKCDGLPLTILVVARLLSLEEKKISPK